jgi:hypothetical protein
MINIAITQKMKTVEANVSKLPEKIQSSAKNSSHQEDIYQDFPWVPVNKKQERQRKR